LRVRIEYFDQNEQFGKLLPVRGYLRRSLTGAHGRRWWVVDLDQPLEYQRKVGEPFRFEVIRTSELVIGSRRQGHEVGETEPTSVHILVPLGLDATQAGDLELTRFDHVAWGICHVEDAA
jgi:hypothetical protein